MPREFKALNSTLFRQLERYYGEGQVEVAHVGRAIRWRVLTTTAGSRDKQPRKVRQVEDSGEEYRVRCKLCKDYRARLHINHRWGVFDEGTGSRNLWLANCFNESCYDEYAMQERLFEVVYGQRPNARTSPIEIGEGWVPEGGDSLGPMDPPGPMIRLDVLQQRQPTHPALTYLEGRGFDPARLGRLWQAAYCSHSIFALVANRIIIPIYANRIMVGWQARYIGDDVNGMPFNQANVPKYWTSPRYKKRLWAYNLDQALRHQTMVMVEGTTDVWNVGPMAFGVMGKTVSEPVLSYTSAALRKDPEKVLVIALDPLQDKVATRKERLHHLDVAFNKYDTTLRSQIFVLKLPDEYDPGSISRDLFRQLCRERAAEPDVDVKVSFGKPSDGPTTTS